MKIKFSVIIPLFNKEDSIKSTINSVLNQSYQNFEIIIVNDGSTDSSLKIVENFKNNKIKVFNNINHGVSYTRNYAIKKSSGNYIAFLDADDFWHNDYLEKMKQLIEKYSNCMIFCSRYEVCLPQKKHYSGKIGINKDGILDSYWRTLSFKYEFVWTSATVINREVFKDDKNFFNIKERIGEDLDLICRLYLNNNTIAYTQEVLVKYNRKYKMDNAFKVGIANPRSYINQLKNTLKLVSLENYEVQAITKKIIMKEIMYIYTLVLNGKNKLARKEIRDNSYIPLKFKIALSISSFMPNFMNKWVYSIRLENF